MGARAVLAGLCLVLWGGEAVARGEKPLREPRTVENAPLPAAEQERIRAAVERGRAWLAGTQNQDGSWGTDEHRSWDTVEVLEALLRTGTRPEAPLVDRGMAYLEKLPRTYDNSNAARVLTVLAAVRGVGDAEERARTLAWMTECVTYLLEHRTKDRALFRPEGRMSDANERQLQKMRMGGCWYFENDVKVGDTVVDIASVGYTCSALTALSLAEEAGIALPRDTWSLPLGRLLDWQMDEGKEQILRANSVRGLVRVEWEETAMPRGFGTNGVVAEPTASETAEGALCILLARHALVRRNLLSKETDDLSRNAVRDALCWLQAHFFVHTDYGNSLSEQPYWHYAYLADLATMAECARVRMIAGRDWYSEAARLLVVRQRPDGAWGTPPHLGTTAEALIALARGRLDASGPGFEFRLPDAGVPTSK